MIKFKDANQIALALVAGIVRDGGATVAPRVNQEVPTEGFMVGGVVKPLVLKPEELETWRIVRWVEDQCTGALQWTGPAFLGSWLDEETGEIHLDVAMVETDLSHASELAKGLGELAIYDIRKGESVRVTV